MNETPSAPSSSTPSSTTAGNYFIRGGKPHFVYFGGGTPSYLSAKQLHELTDRLKAILPWDAAEEIALEAEPGTLNPGKLTAINQVGVTRLSLGIENFDDHILEINGRAHRRRAARLDPRNPPAVNTPHPKPQT